MKTLVTCNIKRYIPIAKVCRTRATKGDLCIKHHKVMNSLSSVTLKK